MGTHDNNKLSEIVSMVKSWIPRKTEPVNISRNFWMPDQSCRVCYECDSQFTVFNRRHHCRICGRVFCAKCAANSVPAPADEPKTSEEDSDRIRVCNYCFKQWQQGAATVDNFVAESIPALSPSPSATSLVSTQSSCSCNSGSSIFSPYSTGPYQHVHCSAGHRSQQSAQMDPVQVKQDHATCSGQSNSIDGGDPFGEQLDFSCSRSDEDDDYYGYGSQTEFNHFSTNSESYDAVTCDRRDGEDSYSKCTSSTSFPNNLEAQNLETVNKLGEADKQASTEASAIPPLYAAHVAEIENVDFENNGLLWLPPDPEDEADEREGLLCDDDDGGNSTTGEWGYQHFSSFDGGEYSAKDKSIEEHMKAMKSVVDGHFRALIAQLLQVENIPVCEEDNKGSWLDIVTSLSLEAATLLKPDTSVGGGMDPGGYVKVKCIASGHRSESMVVKGVVCKKNVAHRRMRSKIDKPRLLVLGGALEYQRVANHLSSFDTLLQQEMDHLRMAVAKIDAHHPNVLLVEKSVSRFAQEYLLAKDISLVLNIKRPLLERIARCTGAQIVPSIDHLTGQKLGYCDLFHVEKLLEERGSAGQDGKKLAKTLMFFEGCPKPLGCTILLKGSSGDELKKVKHVIQYGVFAAYHLALETSFLADEGASLPELPLKSPIKVALPDKPSIERSITMVPGFKVPEKPHGSQTEISSMGKAQCLLSKDKCNEAAFDNFYEAEVSGAHLKETNDPSVSNHFSNSEVLQQKVTDSRADKSTILQGTETAFRNKINHEADMGVSNEDFPPSPSDSQSILVSLSMRCVWKGTVCERAHLSRIKYYGSFDKPLGRFLRDHLFDQGYRCRSCDMPSEAHVHCYTHQQGSLTIAVKKLPEFLLPGEREGKIWMWHRCLRCPRVNGFPPATKRVVMSDAAWGLSFGKFLELSFSDHAAASRVASCGHSLHRDCLRFYGFGRMVACFRYAPIDVHSVYLPPPKLEFKYDNQKWLQKDIDQLRVKASLMFAEVSRALCQISEKLSFERGVEWQELGQWIAELEGLLQKEKEEFEDLLQQCCNRDVKVGQTSVDILEMNKLRRQLVFQSYLWDQRLLIVSCFKSNSFQSLSRPGRNLKAKPTSGPKSTETNMSRSSKGYGSCDSFLLNEKPDTASVREDGQSNLADDVHKHESMEQMINNEKDVEVHLSSSMGNQSDQQKSGRTVRRILSDGQFPVTKNLYDTLDAAWTGDNLERSITAKEDGSTSFDSLLVNASDVTKTAAAPVGVGNCREDRIAAEVSDSHCTVLPFQGPDDIENSISWLRMPFSALYPSLGKSYSSNIQKINKFIEYSPVYVLSFQQLIHQDGARVLLPVGVNDTVIPVYDDEPTSIISYALISPSYSAQVSVEPGQANDKIESSSSFSLLDPVSLLSFHSFDEAAPERSFAYSDESTMSVSGSRNISGMDQPLFTNSLHPRVSFSDNGPHGKVNYTVTCYFAKRFEALRRTCCPSETDFIRSLSRCKKWGAQGGKSNVFFAKTLDERFIIKQVTKTELESFIKFAPAYFKYLSESITTGSPTCLAKILGIYQVTSKHLKGGKESRMDVLVMENLLFQRNITRLYDLKGSSRSRYNPDSSGSNKVLLDQNLIEAMPTSPIFLGTKAKRLLERAVWNDTAFLASIDVMDYSLLVGLDEEKHELVLGIIDFMRQYTWDKHLETWVKASGILGGPKNTSPTVISPKQYKKRFRKAMSAYFIMVPDQWDSSPLPSIGSRSDLSEENSKSGSPLE